jgi:hypothetical protein
VQVIYNTSGWLDKNNDPPPTDFLEAIKEKSTFGFSKVQHSPVLTVGLKCDSLCKWDVHGDAAQRGAARRRDTLRLLRSGRRKQQWAVPGRAVPGRAGPCRAVPGRRSNVWRSSLG